MPEDKPFYERVIIHGIAISGALPSSPIEPRGVLSETASLVCGIL